MPDKNVKKESTKFTPVTKAIELFEYTSRITDNPKLFPLYIPKKKEKRKVKIDELNAARAKAEPETGTWSSETYQEEHPTIAEFEVYPIASNDALVTKVRNLVTEIYCNVAMSNAILLGDGEASDEERLHLQAKAIAQCKLLSVLIPLCCKHFHLSKKRFKYWGQMARSTRMAIEAWHTSEQKRIKELHK